MSDLDRAVGRFMRMRMRAGLFDLPSSVAPYTDIGVDVMNNAAGQQLALDAARQSLVLLQNDEQLLPLKTTDGKIKTIAIVGPNANNTKVLMGGTSDCKLHLLIG